MPTVSFQFTANHNLEGFKRYRRQSTWRLFALSVKAVGVVFFGFLCFLVMRGGDVVASLIFGALTVLILVAHHLEYALFRRAFKKSPYIDEVVLIEFTEEGVYIRSPKQNAQLQWSAWTKGIQFREGLLLLQGPQLFSWIPFASLQDLSDADELVELVRSKVSEFKIREARS